MNVKPGHSIFVLAVGSPLARGQTALAEGKMKTNSVATESKEMIFIVHNHCELADALIFVRKRAVRNVRSAPPNSDATKELCTVKYGKYVASLTVWRVSSRLRKFTLSENACGWLWRTISAKTPTTQTDVGSTT